MIGASMHPFVAGMSPEQIAICRQGGSIHRVIPRSVEPVLARDATEPEATIEPKPAEPAIEPEVQVQPEPEPTMQIAPEATPAEPVAIEPAPAVCTCSERAPRGPTPARDRARELIARMLADGPRPSAEMIRATDEISHATRDRVVREMGVIRRDGVWRLPESAATMPKREQAERLIRDVLAAGPRPYVDIERAAERAGISRTTIHDAARAMRVQVTRTRALHGPYQGGCPSTWCLPSSPSSQEQQVNP